MKTEIHRSVRPVAHTFPPALLQSRAVAEKKPKRTPKLRNVVGDAVRQAREVRGLTQVAVVARLQVYGWDIDRTSWVRIENGERSLTDCELVAVADVLGASVDAMIAAANRAKVRRVLRTVDR